MISVLIFVVVIAIVATLIATWRQSTHLYAPLAVYTYFFGLTFALRPLLLVFGIDTPMPDYLFTFATEALQLKIVVFALAWSVTFLFALTRNITASPVLNLLPATPATATGPLGAVVIGLLTITVLQNAWLIINYGFAVGAISYAVRMDRVFSGFSFFNHIPLFAAYFGMVYVWLTAQRGDSMRSFLAAIASTMAALTYIWYGDRDNIALWFLFALSGTSYFVFRMPSPVLLLIPPALAGFLMKLSTLRLSEWGYIPDEMPLFRGLTSSLNLNCFDNLLLYYAYFGEQSLRWGADFILGFVTLVPRFLWEDKPPVTDIGAWLTLQFNADANYGWPITALGEWAVNFGIVGVILGAYLTGAGYNLLRIKYADAESNPLSFMVMWWLGSRILQIGVSTYTPVGIVLNFIPLVLIVGFIRRQNVNAPTPSGTSLR